MQLVPSFAMGTMYLAAYPLSFAAWLFNCTCFIDFVLSSHSDWCFSRPSPILSENLYKFVKIILDVSSSSSISLNSLVWMTSRSLSILWIRADLSLSLHRSDDLCGACGSSALLLREFAWSISAGKATVDWLVCGLYCAESSFLLEDVGMILLSSLSWLVGKLGICHTWHRL